MSADKPFTKENLDGYLRELAKEFRKKNGNKMSAEIILIGGASILINYGFRDMTYDMDAIIKSSGAMKDAINTVGDRLELPVGWLNTDFANTKSYTPRLMEYSTLILSLLLIPSFSSSSLLLHADRNKKPTMPIRKREVLRINFFIIIRFYVCLGPHVLRRC